VEKLELALAVKTAKKMLILETDKGEGLSSRKVVEKECP